MKKRIIAAVVIIAAVILALMGFVKQINSSLNTVKAQYSYFEDAIDVQAVVIRSEDVYSKEANTVFESEIKDGSVYLREAHSVRFTEKMPLRISSVPYQKSTAG